MQYYLLDGQTPLRTEDLVAWQAWFRTANRTVASTITSTGATVFTEFRGVNVELIVYGPPQVFQTLVIGGVFNGEKIRYATWAEAEAGHKRIVAVVQEQGQVTHSNNHSLHLRSFLAELGSV